MITEFEFYSSEPIENVITCLNFKIDKVIFFDGEKNGSMAKSATTLFLKEKCGVKEVSFIKINPRDFDRTEEIMGEAVQREIEDGNACYFDITGGSSMSLVILGYLSSRVDLPIHVYNVMKNELFEWSDENKISQNVPRHKINMTITSFIELRGGKISPLRKDSEKKDCTKDPILIKDLWNVSNDLGQKWYKFIDTTNILIQKTEGLQFCLNADKLNGKRHQTKKLLRDEYESVLGQLCGIGAIEDCQITESEFHFRCKNSSIKKGITVHGALLEMAAFLSTRRENSSCDIGVFLDWDGVITKDNTGTINEVDVLSVSHNIPVFTSCKSGELVAKKALAAFYELDTIAKRFGGIYVKKQLITPKRALTPAIIERAAEMNIHIVDPSELTW